MRRAPMAVRKETQMSADTLFQHYTVYTYTYQGRETFFFYGTQGKQTPLTKVEVDRLVSSGARLVTVDLEAGNAAWW